MSERAQQFNERWAKLGCDIDLSGLFFDGERSNVVDYLTDRGWQVSTRPRRELFADYGRASPTTTTWPSSATSSPSPQRALGGHDDQTLRTPTRKRFDGDSWDLASSVGATATAVAARRALASKGPNPLIDDPFAEPLVNAVGVDAFIRMMNGEIEARRGRSRLHPAAAQRRHGGAHPVLRLASSSTPPKPACARRSSWPPGWTPAPTGWRGRPGPSSTRSTSPG